MNPNIPRFLCSWSNQLHAAADQVRDLIGSRHWLSDGRHKERLLSEFLRGHLPSVCSLSTGFVFPILEPQKVSREVDILVTDTLRACPLISSGDLTITPPLGLIAHIHVKSDLSKQSFADAVDTAVSVTRTLSPSPGRRPLAGLYFFEHQRGTLNARFFKPFKNQLLELMNPALTAGFVMCAGKDTFGVGKLRTDSSPARLVIFNIEQLAAGAFVANLLNAVETYFEGESRRPELLQAVAHLAPAPLETIEL